MMVRRPAKVLVTVKGLGIGGAERLISEAARFWNRDRFDYQVAYALPWKDQLASVIEDLGIPVHCVGTAGQTSMPSVVGLRRLVNRLRPDLIHAHLPTMGIAARWFTTGPVVYTEHNLAHSYHPLTRLVNRISYRRNAAVIAVSEAVADSASGYPGPRPLVILNAVDCKVDPARVSAARQELGIDPGVPLVVHVGNIRPNKGHENLIRATSILKDEFPDLVVVSIGGEKRAGDLERLSSLSAEVGVERTFRILGRREDALSFVAAADVFVSPAEIEGLPVALLEAMGLGRPVVATAVGGVPRLVRHEVNGLLVKPLIPVELAKAVKRILSDTDLAVALGQQARADVEREHGLEQMVRRIETVYEEVLSRGDGS